MSELSNHEILNSEEETKRAKLAFENYHEALQYVNYVNSVKGEINSEVICEIHSRCMRGLLPETAVGRYRTVNVGINRSIRTPPPWERVRDLMDNFLEDLNERLSKCSSNLNDMPCLIETIAFAHYVFERIHPFEDGNGRVGRLLCDLIAKRFGLRPIIIWPPDRQRYIEALEAVNRSGNLAHLTLFLAKQFLNRYPENERGQNSNIRKVLEKIIKTQEEKIKEQKSEEKEANIWEGFTNRCFD